MKWLLPALIFSGVLQAATWSPAVDVSSGYDTQVPQIAMSENGSKAIAVWSGQDAFDHDIVQASYTADGGSIWSAPQSLSTAGQSADEPQIAMSQNGLKAVIVWFRFDGSNTIVQSAQTADGGISWDPVVNVSPLEQDSLAPQVALSSDGTKAVAVWVNGQKIQSAFSTNGGGSWTLADVSLDGQNVDKPQIALSGDGTQAVAVWVRSNGVNTIVQSACWTFGGASWSVPSDRSMSDQDADVPQIAISEDGAQAIAVWKQTNGSYTIVQTSHSTDGGASWSSRQNLSAADQNADVPQIALSENGAAVAVWLLSDGVNLTIQSAASDDSGVSWGTPVNLSTPASVAGEPQVAMSEDGTKAVAVWKRRQGSSNLIQATYSTDGAASWDTPVNLSASGHNALQPQVAMNGNGLQAISVWVRPNEANYMTQASHLIYLPPASAQGSRFHERFAFQNFYYNLLSWTASPSAAIQDYRIYSGSDLLGSVPARSFEYRDQPVAPNETRIYTIKSFNGVDESDGISVTIP